MDSTEAAEQSPKIEKKERKTNSKAAKTVKEPARKKRKRFPKNGNNNSDEEMRSSRQPEISDFFVKTVRNQNLIPLRFLNFGNFNIP